MGRQCAQYQRLITVLLLYWCVYFCTVAATLCATVGLLLLLLRFKSVSSSRYAISARNLCRYAACLLQPVSIDVLTWTLLACSGGAETYNNEIVLPAAAASIRVNYSQLVSVRTHRHRQQLTTTNGRRAAAQWTR